MSIARGERTSQQWLEHGRALVARSRAEAIEAFRNALQADPGSDALRDLLALFPRGSSDRLELCRWLVGIHPEYYLNWIGLGLALSSVRDYPGAEEAVTRALETAQSGNERGLALYNRACYRALQGVDADQVLVDLAASAELVPGYRKDAGTDSDFASIHESEPFKRFVSG